MNRILPAIVISLAVLTGCTPTPQSAPIPTTKSTQTPPPKVDSGVVNHVVDGDTIRLSDGRTIRLIGIDTPEKGQCGYREATRAMSRLVNGKTVTLVFPKSGKTDDHDRYGRLLRYVRAGATDVGLELIEAGRAKPRYNSTDGYGFHDLEPTYKQAAETHKNLNVCGSL
jgi:endonuclease YncB( thermonuclease family)